MKPQLTVGEFYKKEGEGLDLRLISTLEGLENVIHYPEAQRPGLSLAGYVKRKSRKRLLVFGRVELEYLRDLEVDVREKRLRGILSPDIPAVILSRNLSAPKEFQKVCTALKIPLFRSSRKATPLTTDLVMALKRAFAPETTVHGTLIEAFGIGVLLQGDSSVGKSEAALGLIERKHRLISDDVVLIQRGEGDYLLGKGTELNRHILEIRGIGIINVAHIYGAVSVREHVGLDMIVHLEGWNEEGFYDRVGFEERFQEILGVDVPSYLLPVKPGRDVVLLIETTVLNHRLKKMGYHSAKEFNKKLLKEIAKREREEIDV